jgi:tetratricopeptide (TPR) repeat protein
MKKIILVLASMVMAAGIASAQTMAEATELYNNGATAISMEKWTEALDCFQKALTMGTEIGEEANDLVANCKTAIPGVALEIAKDLIKENKFDEAFAKVEEVAKISEEYGNEEVAAKAVSLKPEILIRKGNFAEDGADKDYATAADCYAKAYAMDTTAGKTALRLGAALKKLGKNDEAIKAFQHAGWNGEEEVANKQIATIYLQDAQVAYKAKKFADAIKAAEKANAIAENPNAYLIAGQSAQGLKKNADAIKNFEKYLELKPTASNANGIAFTVAALYQQSGNKGKALEYYKKVENDAKFGAQAKQQITALGGK